MEIPQNAVLFFDECESLFTARGRGGSAQTTALLTVMERFHGLIFLATNRPFDLDEAMHRRIHYCVHFKPPNHVQRRAIWQLHTSSGLGADVPVRMGGFQEAITCSFWNSWKYDVSVSICFFLFFSVFFFILFYFV